MVFGNPLFLYFYDHIYYNHENNVLSSEVYDHGRILNHETGYVYPGTNTNLRARRNYVTGECIIWKDTMYKHFMRVAQYFDEKNPNHYFTSDMIRDNLPMDQSLMGYALG